MSVALTPLTRLGFKKFEPCFICFYCNSELNLV